ncbi:hypothetical protein [Dendrosporobacter sp. 1207_IL3150]|uniref:hypothetical protein n=1 Tax=Dendrosporobacter sp. 1207_IL3150 TaxID=3084054 RepID=UPI002FDAAB09
MKKSVLIIAAAVILSVATVGSAATPEVNGDIRIRIQDRAGDTDSPTKGTFTITRVRLNASMPIENNTSVFGRLALEQAAGEKAHSNGLYDTSGAFDRWGVKWKYKNGALKVGRQDVVLGQDGLVLTTLIDAVGESNQLTGIDASWKEGNTSLKLVGGRLGSGLFQPLHGMEANLYALQVNRKIDQRFSGGATYRRISTIDNYSTTMANLIPPNKSIFNTYSLFGSYCFDSKNVVYTEIGSSNADSDDNGLSLGLAHRIDKKNSYSINYFKQERYSGMFRNWGAPDFAREGSNTSWNGYALYYRYQMNDKTLLEISDYYEKGNVSNSANQFRVTLLANF